MILGPFLVVLGPFLVLVCFPQPHRSHSSIYKELNPGADPSRGFLSAFSLCIPAFPRVPCPRVCDLNVPAWPRGDEFGFGKGFCANCAFPQRENEAGWDRNLLPALGFNEDAMEPPQRIRDCHVSSLGMGDWERLSCGVTSFPCIPVIPVSLPDPCPVPRRKLTG